jgi:hypothetical protein
MIVEVKNDVGTKVVEQDHCSRNTEDEKRKHGMLSGLDALVGG